MSYQPRKDTRKGEESAKMQRYIRFRLRSALKSRGSESGNSRKNTSQSDALKMTSLFLEPSEGYKYYIVPVNG